MANARIFRYFKTSPEFIRLAVMMGVRYPRSLRNVEGLLHERGIGIAHETGRFRWNRFGATFASEGAAVALVDIDAQALAQVAATIREPVPGAPRAGDRTRCRAGGLGLGDRGGDAGCVWQDRRAVEQGRHPLAARGSEQEKQAT